MNHRDKVTQPRTWRFFAWTFLWSLPFYVWGVVAPVRGLPFGLPATAIMVIIPASAALMMARQENRLPWPGVSLAPHTQLSPGWLAFTLLCMPLATAIGALAMLASGVTLPPASWPTPLHLSLMVSAYVIGAVFEEIGWTGYATDPLIKRWGIPGTGLIIGAIWACWHVVPWWLGQGHSLYWVSGQVVLTVLMRVMMVWIFAHGGRSLALAILFHTSINVSYSLFPHEGSHYDPWAVLVGLAIVVLLTSILRRLWRG